MVTQDDLLLLLEQRTEINGRFANFRRLSNGGAGNFSVLVSADDSRTNDRVAVKVCLPQSDRYRVECFEREAHLLEVLTGQSDIIQLIAPRSTFTEMLATQGGLQLPWEFHYYAVELAHGDVGDVIASGNWLPERMLLAFRTLCRAVQRIHSQRIAHRDLKPSNILVMPNGQVKLSDFGTARRIDSVTPALVGAYTAPPGDRRYCAPEMLGCLHDENPEIAFTSDFFSLGAILFEMFSGTMLGLRLFNPQFWADIAQAMLAIRIGQRRTTYDQVVSSIANSRPLPSVSAFGAPVPPSIRDRVNDLYRSLSSIDYRVRLCDFDRIFQKINICLLILRNERAYQRWIEQKRTRRAAALLRTSGVRS
ncbi:MAG: protein kinase family protein [Boseongicola sp. SB0670_bin_30]|nr:protein kinase family protein [Boseongicola sp. SB0670_bin_30]